MDAAWVPLPPRLRGVERGVVGVGDEGDPPLVVAAPQEVSAAVKAGIDESSLAQIVGHSRLVQTYVHIDADQRAAVGEAVVRQLT